MRVLISAYACEPGRGSEPGAGWAWARAAAERHEVWLLTRTDFAASIERTLAAEPGLRKHLHLVPLDLPAWLVQRRRGEVGDRWYYPMWQVAAWRVASILHRQVHFDVAHHLTFGSDSMPAGVAWLRGLPLVWGPVGGSGGPPWRLWRWLGWRGFLFEVSREVGTRTNRRLFGRPVARRAALVVAQNNDVAHAFRAARRVVVEPHIAVEGMSTSRVDGRRAGRRAVFVARLVPWKGARLAVACLARPAAAGWHLDLYGTGPDADNVRRLADRLGVADRVTFKGQHPRTEVLAALDTADALLFPSMHDSAGWAVAEALSRGCPVVCLDRGGPAVLVGPGEGVRVPVRGDVVGELAHALASLPGRIPPSDRWAPARIPGLVTSWYEQTAGKGGVK
jgi:glycosyltransferase involved in cell wall biosynthesis